MRLSRPPGKKPIAVVVADANVMACRFVCAQLKKHSRFHLVGCASTVGDLLVLLERRKAAVALVSATLQDGWLSGIAAFPQLQERYPEVRLILVIDQPETKLVLEAFRAGARGVFTRYESPIDALRKCISCVHAGQIWANAQQLDCLVNAVAQAHTVRLVNAEGFNLLSKREDEVVLLVAEGLNNHQIAQQLHLSDHTVKNHLFHIFDKLGISNRVELVLYAVSRSRRAAMPVSSSDAPVMVKQASASR